MYPFSLILGYEGYLQAPGQCQDVSIWDCIILGKTVDGKKRQQELLY